MIRGTTPTHIFELPFDTCELTKIRILYAQNDEMILEKTEKDCELNGPVIKVRLTQEETMKVKHLDMVQIQLHVLTSKDDSLVSNVYKVPAYQLLKDEVLSNETES